MFLKKFKRGNVSHSLHEDSGQSTPDMEQVPPRRKQKTLERGNAYLIVGAFCLVLSILPNDTIAPYAAGLQALSFIWMAVAQFLSIKYYTAGFKVWPDIQEAFLPVLTFFLYVILGIKFVIEYKGL